MKQYVYSFKEGNKDMRVILGGKGANLAEMTSIGLPVPQGFTVSTEACTAYYEDGKQISPEICAQIDNKLAELEAETGKKLGDPTNPLLVSVRSGARESMPGMMDTVLNLGLNDEVATGFTKITNNERFVYDSYRRFIQMFADVVMGFPKSSFERKFDDIKEEINKNYEKIQEQVSIIDANLRNIASTSKASDNNVIITSTNALKFLENYGFKVISIEDDDNYTTELKNNFKSGKYKTLFIKKGESNDKINELKDTYKAKNVEVNMMDVLDDNERKNNEDYLSIMNSFLQNISDTCLNESK